MWCLWTLEMPEMDGYGALAEIRKINSHTPAICDLQRLCLKMAKDWLKARFWWFLRSLSGRKIYMGKLFFLYQERIKVCLIAGYWSFFFSLFIRVAGICFPAGWVNIGTGDPFNGASLMGCIPAMFFQLFFPGLPEFFHGISFFLDDNSHTHKAFNEWPATVFWKSAGKIIIQQVRLSPILLAFRRQIF